MEEKNIATIGTGIPSLSLGAEMAKQMAEREEIPAVVQQPGIPKYTYLHGSTRIRNGHKLRRNEPCPCGSGKKYKRCCVDSDTFAVKEEN